MAGITAELDLQIGLFQNALRRAEEQFNGFSRRTSAGAGGSMGSGIGSALQNGLGAITTALTGAVVGGAAVAGAAGGAAILGGMKRAMDEETLQMSYNVLVGDDDKAKEVLADLRKLGESTPFEFPELADAGRKLIAFGEDAGNVTEALRRIGDVSSGVGAPISDIAEIYGKARVAGTLFAEDINQLTGRGIPIIGEFAKQMGVSEAEVKKLASQGKITFPMLEQAFKDLTGEGGKFAGMMAAQSGTVAGLLSTLKDSFGSVLLELGRPINDAIRPLLKEGIGLVDDLKTTAAKAGESIAGAIKAIIAAWQTLSFEDMGELARAGLSLGFKSVINLLYAGLMGAVSAFGAGVVEHGKTLWTVLGVVTTGEFWRGLGNVLLGIFQGVVAFLGNAIANLLTQFKEVPGLGKLIGEADEAMRDVARDYGEASGNNLEQGGANLAPALEAVTARYVEAGKNIAKAFGDGFSKAGDVMDTSGEKSAFEDARKRIGATIAANEEKSKKEAEKIKGEGENGKPAATTGDGFAVNGRISGAINSIMGRSTNELLASSMQQVAEGVAEVKKNTAAIAENTKPKTDTKAKPAASKTPTGVFT